MAEEKVAEPCHGTWSIFPGDAYMTFTDIVLALVSYIVKCSVNEVAVEYGFPKEKHCKSHGKN